MQKDEYEKLGSYALIGLPTELYKTRQASFKSQHTLETTGKHLHACWMSHVLEAIATQRLYQQCFTATWHTCRFIEDGEMKTQYPIVIGGDNFGCGSSREHAPVCMGAAGMKCQQVQE